MLAVIGEAVYVSAAAITKLNSLECVKNIVRNNDKISDTIPVAEKPDYRLRNMAPISCFSVNDHIWAK